VSALSQQEIDAMVKASHQSGPGKSGTKQRSVQSCNFRSAGRLSNENARTLTALHETFARNLTNALDAYLGTGLEVKLLSIDQISIEDYIAGLTIVNQITPFALSTMQSTMIMECDLALVFPIIDLLLGGNGTDVKESRELSEIDEEIMQGVTSQIAKQVERAWRILNVTLTPNHCIKSSAMLQYFPPKEKVVLVMFEVDVAGATGSFNIVFPTSFANTLVRQIKMEQSQKRGGVRFFPTASIRERILDCDVLVAADIPRVRVMVRDLIALQPGNVLKLRAPVRAPGMLTVGGREVFEAVPVRNGSQKATQLGRRAQLTGWEKE
jgi:flagellar motor switch protein FliM